jgi:hypothetical protein
VGLFLWWKMMQPVGVALVMDRASIFVNLAVAQIDWLETDGTQEGSISAHEHPQVRQLCIREGTACKRKDDRHDAELDVHPYRKSPDVDLSVCFLGNATFRSLLDEFLRIVLLNCLLLAVGTATPVDASPYKSEL